MQDNIVDSHRTTDGRREGGTDGWMDGWMGGLVDGWVGGWVDGLMDGWREGGTHGRTSHLYLSVHQPCNDVVPLSGRLSRRPAATVLRGHSRPSRAPSCRAGPGRGD